MLKKHGKISLVAEYCEKMKQNAEYCGILRKKERLLKEVKKRPPKIEFYSSLPEIRAMYESGIVFGTAIFDSLSKSGKITMSYRQFATYFKKEIVDKLQNSTPKKEDEPAAQNTGSTSTTQQPETETKATGETSEPIWLTVGEKKKTAFNPHSREIDPKDVL